MAKKVIADKRNENKICKNEADHGARVGACGERKPKVKWKGGALLAPVPPTLISCGSLEKPNVLTVAWTGILNTQPPKTYVSIRPSRYSYELIKESGEFVINLTSKELVRTADFCGVRSGRDVDKFEQCGITAAPSSDVEAPSVAEAPVSLECKVTDSVLLGAHEMFIADIVAVTVAPELVDKDGRLCLENAGLVAYAHGEYFELGKRLGSFGYSVRKKKSSSRSRSGADGNAKKKITKKA